MRVLITDLYARAAEAEAGPEIRDFPDGPS